MTDQTKTGNYVCFDAYVYFEAHVCFEARSGQFRFSQNQKKRETEFFKIVFVQLH